jgi:hypothetical protein
LRLEDAAENFDDSVVANEDFDDTLYDLFYLDLALSRVESNLKGFTQENLVDSRMQAFRYYVNELLFTYRQSY